MTLSFELEGQPFLELDDGPSFTFKMVISFQVFCDTRDGMEHDWEVISPGGDKVAQQCGCLKGKDRVSWRLVPRALLRKIKDSRPETPQRITEAMLQMEKLDIEALERAYMG